MSRKHLSVVQEKSTQLNLPAEELQLLESMLSAYRDRRLGSLNHTERTVHSDIATIRDFLTFVQKAPWSVDEDDFDAWCYHLGIERKVVTETQRKYQTAVQVFFRYIIENVKFQAEVWDRFGIRLRQIVTEENKIPHLHERQRTNERPAFTHPQIDQLFSAIEHQIIDAYKFSSKEFLTLQRDKAMFFAMYTLGLRDSECCSLNINSFKENPKIPEFGDFGFATVYGKGSRGSGPKIRNVPVDHADLPPLLQWYVEDVRPIYLAKPHSDPNEEAFFLTERGTGMKRSTLIARFHKVLDYAGLEGLGFTPHCLRHTYTTHSLEWGRSLEYTRRKLGHEYAATTQGYTQLGDEFVNRELTQCATSLIDKAMKDSDKEDQGGES